MNDSNNDNGLFTDVKIMKNDISSVESILNRFDTTINKLTDVSNNLNKLIAVQETRIDTQEKSIDIVHKRITDMKEEINLDLASSNRAIMDELEGIRRDQSNNYNETSQRISNLEKWRYIVMGAGISVGFLLAESTLLENIF